MKNSIGIFVILSFLAAQAFGQKSDTLWFSKEKNYSRCLVQSGNQLFIGTSATGVLAYDLKLKTTTSLLPNVHQEEVRDLWLYKNTLYAMFSGDHGFVYAIDLKTKSSQLILADSNTFLDDLCGDKNHLYILGDPKNGHFYLRTYAFKEKTFTDILPNVPAFASEACYAASGTTALINQQGAYCFVSGGGGHTRFHVFVKRADRYLVNSTEIPLANGDGCGPFTLTTYQNALVVMGGCWNAPTKTDSTGVRSMDNGKTWNYFDAASGYRSGAIACGKQLFTCGTHGIDSFHRGTSMFNSFCTGNFCALYVHKKTLYATTNKGYILRFEIP